MNTDTALEFRAKLFIVNKKLKKIEELGFNVDNYKKELDDIINELEIQIKSSKNIKFEGFLINDYINALNKLTKLEDKLDSYDIYIKAYYYTKYLKNTDLININNIISELKKILIGIRNSSVLDYNDEAHIVEGLYHEVYNVIKKEIELNKTHELFDFCKKDEIDSNFLEEEISREIDSFDIQIYSDITTKYYEIMKDGNDANLFNLELITSIIYKDKKEELIESICNNTKNLVEMINSNTTELNKSIDASKHTSNEIYLVKKKIREQEKQLIKKLCAISLVLSIPVGVFFLCKNKEYHTTTRTYNSYTGNIKEDVGYYSIEQNESVYALDYDNSGISTILTKYDLSYLNYDSIYDYIKYFEEGHNLNYETRYGVNKDSISVKDNVDYFEIVYIMVNTDDYKYDYFTSFCLSLVVLLAILLSRIITESRYDNITIKEILNAIKESKYLNKEKIDQLRQINRILLDRIKEDDNLRRKFNEEIIKHKEIIDILDYEVIEIKDNEYTKDIKSKNRKFIKD